MALSVARYRLVVLVGRWSRLRIEGGLGIVLMSRRCSRWSMSAGAIARPAAGGDAVLGPLDGVAADDRAQEVALAGGDAVPHRLILTRVISTRLPQLGHRGTAPC